MNLVLVWASKLTCFRAGVKIDFVFVCGPKIARFYRMDRKRLGFCVGGENDLFLMWASIDLIFV